MHAVFGWDSHLVAKVDDQLSKKMVGTEDSRQTAMKEVKVGGHRLKGLEMEAHRQPVAPHLEVVMVVTADSHQMKVGEVKVLQVDPHQLKEMMEMEVHRQPTTAHPEKVMVVAEDSHQVTVKELKVGGHRLEEMVGKEDPQQTTMREMKADEI